MNTLIYILAIIGIVFIVFIILAINGPHHRAWTKHQTLISEGNSLKEPYWLRSLVEFDVFCNVFLFHGIPGETISSRIGRWSKSKTGEVRWFIRIILYALERIQWNHGEQAQSGDLARAQRVVTIESYALRLNSNATAN